MATEQYYGTGRRKSSTARVYMTKGSGQIDLLILGPALASLMFGPDVPERSGSARVTVLPSLDELAASADARRACWQALRSSGILRRQGASPA